MLIFLDKTMTFIFLIMIIEQPLLTIIDFIMMNYYVSRSIICYPFANSFLLYGSKQADDSPAVKRKPSSTPETLLACCYPCESDRMPSA